LSTGKGDVSSLVEAVVRAYRSPPRSRRAHSKARKEKMRQKNRRGTDKVIHVVFGPGGGRVESRPHRPPEGGTVKASAELPDTREPITDMFSGSEVARLLGFSTARLRTLDRAGVVSPSGRRRGRRAYTFADLIALRAAQGLLARRVRLRDVTRAV